MKKFTFLVENNQTVAINVLAETEEEARAKLEDCIFEDEEPIEDDYQFEDAELDCVEDLDEEEDC